jgi:peptide chain release factor 3
MDDIELLDGADSEFDLDAVLAGQLTPVFFGSALTNFGVEPFLKDFLRLAPRPKPTPTCSRANRRSTPRPRVFGLRLQNPGQHGQAPPRPHRVRAHLLGQVRARHGRRTTCRATARIKLAVGTSMMAEDRAIVDEAYAGDIVGLFDPGIFSIGDTICVGQGPRAVPAHAHLRARALRPHHADQHAQAQAVREGLRGAVAGRRHPALPSRWARAPRA